LKYIPRKEGVILQAAAEDKRIEKKEDFNRTAGLLKKEGTLKNYNLVP
jgi:hypothetical protein